MAKITNSGGEGVMLRTADSLYEQKRSKKLLKVKIFADAEARVISYEPGTGRLTGMMGALRVIDEYHIEFKIGGGFTDE
jgi:DNA ligase-1